MAFFDWLTPELRSELQDGSFNPGATDEQLDAVARRMHLVLPNDYRAFMKESNGAAFHLGDSYVVLSAIEDLPELSARYHLAQKAPSLVLFGTNAASDGFGFDARSSPHRIVLCSLDHPSLLDGVPQGSSFAGFLERIRTRKHLAPA